MELEIDPMVAEALAGRALFYPCSGNDVMCPITLFHARIVDFYFVDTRPIRVPRVDFATRSPPVRDERRWMAEYEDRESGQGFCVHGLERDAREVLGELPPLGVFFFRGDNPHT